MISIIFYGILKWSSPKKLRITYLWNYFCLELSNIEHTSSIILQNLGQILPSKLEYLRLFLYIKASDFEVFLKNSHNTFIKKLVINNRSNEDILPYIKEYIMKEKRVKYLAIYGPFFNNITIKYRDMFYLKNEVEEFKLHDINVQNYNDLYFSAYAFIKELLD